MLRLSGPAVVELPLFLIAYETISEEEWGVELSSEHSLKQGCIRRFEPQFMDVKIH